MSRAADAAPGKRALAKQKTRDRVLSAARQQFAKHGFEAATIRDIAARAGMSTGAVFASFSDKADLFQAVVIEDVEAINTAMAAAAAVHLDNIDDALAGILSAGFDRHRDQLPILKDELAFSWVQDDDARAGAIRGVASMRQNVSNALEAAVLSGQLSHDIDIPLISLLIWDAFLSDLRRVVFFGDSPADLPVRQRRNAEVILRGCRVSV